MVIHEKEMQLTQAATEYVEWSSKKHGEYKVNVLFSDFYPIISNKTFVSVDYDAYNEKKHRGVTLFRPIKNMRHCQYLIDFLFTECGVQDILISKNNKSGAFKGRLINEDGTELKISGLYSEVEVKFALFYLFMTDEDIVEDIKEIRAFNINENKSKNVKGGK